LREKIAKIGYLRVGKKQNSMKKTAIFPGSFDPFTLGHQCVVGDGLKLFDRIVVGIGVNPSKSGLLEPQERLRLVVDLYRGEPRVEVMEYDGLTVDFARRVGAKYILRGLRNGVDFEFERNMMQVNQMLYPELMTVVLFTPPEYVAISSSFVREIHRFGGDTSQFMPEGICLEDYLR
jgi:pantetheine-phosphate adenylyltransferase